MRCEGTYIGDAAVAECFSCHAEDGSSMSAVVENERLKTISEEFTDLFMSRMICTVDA
jgi:hypothetical protein